MTKKYKNSIKISNVLRKKSILLSKILFWFCIFVSLSHSTFALTQQSQDIYTQFITQVEKNYSLLDQEIVLKKLRSRLTQYYTWELSSTKSQVVSEIIELNHEAIYDNWLLQNQNQNSQISLELKTRLILKDIDKNIEFPSYVSGLLEKDSISYIWVNSNREYVDWKEIFQISYATYFKILPSNASTLSQKKWVIIKASNGDFHFIESYSRNKKIPYSELSGQAFAFITPEYKIQLENWKYSGFIFTTLQYYPDRYGVFEKQLENSWSVIWDILVYRDESWKYNFVKKFTKRLLISDSESFWITEKHLFLKYLLSDAKFLESDIPENMKKIKSFTKTLTNWQTDDEALETIYDWVLNNVEYTKDLDLDDMKIFSWSEAFFRKDWVCTAYSKLMVYMMMYSWMYDLEMIEWYVIDAPDFPNIWHAWVRYKDRFYDPTFDDPIGALANKTRDEYKYFQIPQDIFYTNRFHYEDLPESFYTASKNDIEQFIYEWLLALVPKYRGELSKYEIFNPVVFRDTFNISSNVILNPEIIAQNVWFETVEWKTFSYTNNGTTYQISALNYYLITADNTETVLSQLSYNLDDTKLYKWLLEDGSSEWRLWYNIKLR